MTYFVNEISRIKRVCYSNNGQLDTVIEARHFIEDNFDKELNLELLSKSLFTSKFHMLRLFKRYYGVTPKQYLIGKRIECAKRYLSTGMTVSDTCFNIGFNSPCSFSTLFRSRVGVSPIEFQKEQLSQSQSKCAC